MNIIFNNQFFRQQISRLFYVLLFCIISLSVYATEPHYQNTKKDTTVHKWEKFSISAGGFFTGLNTDIVVGSEQLGLGVVVNLENALGFETTNFVFRSDLEYYFGKHNRHVVKGGYFGFYRNANKILETEITIGDKTYPVGSNINSKYNLQIIRLAYDYNYFLDKRVKLGASIGFFVMPISFSTTVLSSKSTAADFIAPLPVLGLDATFAIGPKVYIKQSIEVFYLKVANFKGSINDVNIRAEYNPWKHFGFGVGYNYFQLGISGESSKNNFFRFAGDIKSGYTGLMFYVRYFL